MEAKGGGEEGAWLRVCWRSQHQLSRIGRSYHWTRRLQARQARPHSQEPRGPLGIRPIG